MKRMHIMILVMTVALLSMLEMGYAVAAEDRFILVQGRHVEVCEAYLARLNATKFEHPPFCDRPENTSVPGFALLRRVPLTPAEAFELWLSVGAMEKPASNTEDWTLAAATQELGRTILAWKYDPEVDIQNNGSMQPLIMWRGSRVNFGIETSDFSCGMQWDRRTPQLAFILNASQNQVDEAATKRVFWRPKPAILSNTVDGKLHQHSIDLPIGRYMNIFEFKDLYYFDTFYDPDEGGDYQNKRRKDKALENTLAVFLNRDGETREMCEVRLKTVSEQLWGLIDKVEGFKEGVVDNDGANIPTISYGFRSFLLGQGPKLLSSTFSLLSGPKMMARNRFLRPS